MYKSEAEKQSVTIKIRDFLKLIKALEGVLDVVPSENKELLLFLGDLKKILEKHGRLEGSTFLDILTKALAAVDKKKKTHSTLLGEMKVEEMSNDEIKSIISNPKIVKNDLLLIAEKRMGISRGSLKRIKKELIRNRILNEIENIEKFKAIQRKASE